MPRIADAVGDHHRRLPGGCLLDEPGEVGRRRVGSSDEVEGVAGAVDGEDAVDLPDVEGELAQGVGDLAPEVDMFRCLRRPEHRTPPQPEPRTVPDGTVPHASSSVARARDDAC
jgi:hypothetical protein